MAQPLQANANVATKPVVMAAKKALKEVTKDSAVEMAEHIAFEMAMNEFLNGPPSTEQGFEPVCLDGKTKKYEDCPSDKRAQVKKTLSATDKKNIADKVEDIIEKKTNTDTRLTKFLDFFVPIFIISGTVSFITTQLDGDDQSLIDDMANEALKSLGLIKPLVASYEIIDYEPYFESAKVVGGDCFFNKGDCPTLELVPSQKVTLTYGYYTGSPKVLSGTEGYVMLPGVTYTLGADILGGYSKNPYRAEMTISSIKINRNGSYVATISDSDISIREQVSSEADAIALSKKMVADYKLILYDNTSKSNAINNFFKQLQPWNEVMNFGVVPTNVPNDIDLNHLKPSEKTKYKDGDDFGMAGQSSIPIKTPEGNRVFPKDDGTWTDPQGNPVDVDEDTLIVDDVTTTDTETPPEEEEKPPLACSKDMELPDFKPIADSFTHAFPFSIPWDIKRFIDNAFGGIDDERPRFELSFLSEGTVLEIPPYFDKWVSFAKGFVIIVFDIGILFLFYRFMKGGSD